MPIPIAIPAASWIAGLLGLGGAAALSKSNSKDLKGFMEYLIKGKPQEVQQEVQFVRTSPEVAANIGATSLLATARKKGSKNTKKQTPAAKSKQKPPTVQSKQNNSTENNQQAPVAQSKQNNPAENNQQAPVAQSKQNNPAEQTPENKPSKRGALETIKQRLQQLRKSKQNNSAEESQNSNPRLKKFSKKAIKGAATLMGVGAAYETFTNIPRIGEEIYNHADNNWNYRKGTIQIGDDNFIPAAFIVDPESGIEYGIPKSYQSDTIPAYRISSEKGDHGSKRIIEGETKKVIKTLDPIQPYRFYQEPTIVDQFSAPAPIIPKKINKPKVAQPPTIEEQLDSTDRIYNVRVMQNFVPTRFRNG